jgi:hypothetical protein
MLAFKAPACVAAVATVLLGASALFPASSNDRLAIGPWLLLLLASCVNFLLIFVVGSLSMPAAILCQKFIPRTHIAVRFVIALVSGLVMVFLCLWLLETPSFETDGDTTTYRHAGPSVNAPMKVVYYLFAAPVLVLTLVVFHWLDRKAGRVTDQAADARRLPRLARYP